MKQRAKLFVWWWAATLSWTLVVTELREFAFTEGSSRPDAPEEEFADASSRERGPTEEFPPGSANAGVEEPSARSLAAGRVLDTYGNPVDRARVTFAGRRPGSVLTASDGSFAIPVDEGFPARVWCLGRPLREDGSGAACLGTDEVLASAGDRDLLLHAEWFEGPPPAPVTVLFVQDPAGYPLSGLLVEAPREGRTTDAEGRCVLRGREGEVFLPSISWPQGSSPGDDWVLPVLEPRLPGGDWLIRYRIGRVVEGYVADPDGRAAVGVRVTITAGPTEIVSVQTDASGRFSALVDPLPPLPYCVKAGRYDPRDGWLLERAEALLTDSSPAILKLERRR